MKTKTTITNITHEDLVELLSTALTYSNFFGCDYNIEDYQSLRDKCDEDCIEDKLAKLLLDGKSIVIYDMYAEDETDFYGKLKHKWDSENRTMDYTVTLKDILKGLQKCLDNKEAYIRKSAMEFVNYDDGNFDIEYAETIMQVVIFGEVIYG